MEYSVSTLKTNTIQAATGTTLNITNGHKLSGSAGSIVIPGTIVQTLQSIKTDTQVIATSFSFTQISGLTVTVNPESICIGPALIPLLAESMVIFSAILFAFVLIIEFVPNQGVFVYFTA